MRVRHPLPPLLILLAALLFPGLPQAQEMGPFAQGNTNGVGQNAITMLVLLTALSLAPAILIMVSAFPFIVTVLSILRQSIGLQQSPPNMLIIGLSLILTWFVMQPVISDVWTLAGQPLRDGTISIEQAVERGIPPVRAFMELRTDPGTLARLADVAPDPDAPHDRLSVLVPAFMISEIQRAFEIGFLIALPFLIIDLVVSAVLMSMGMMMLPPAVVSLPFKLAFFSVVNGWELIASALVRSYQ